MLSRGKTTVSSGLARNKVADGYNARKAEHKAVARGDSKVSIDDRPAAITNRERVGDLEVDFIVSGKTGSGYVLTAADRKLRVGFISKILPVTVGNVLRVLLDIKNAFPELVSITTDNDLFFRYYKLD